MTPEEHKTYLLHARRYLPRRIDEALTRARDGIEAMQKPTISMSFGKDSTVMAHLILTQIDWKIPLVFVDCGFGDEWPDTERVKSDFLQNFPCELITLRGPSILDAFQEGGFFLEETPNTQAKHKADSKYQKSLAKTIDAYLIDHGYDGSFVGLRRQESNNRDRLFTMRSHLYYAKTRKIWISCPMETWTGTDIWAYITEHSLPYNELYDKSVFGRERARNGAMSGNLGFRYGRLVELKLSYPDWFNRLATQYPEIRRYV